MVAASALITGGPCPAAAQTSEDSVAIRALVEAYRVTWNEHDLSALATFFTQDADMIMGSDSVADGRAAIQGWWRDYFARQEPERRLAIDVRALRLITPAVAVLNAVTTTQGRNAQGEALNSRKARGTWVVVREGDTWRISAMRGMPTEQDRIIRGPDRKGQVERFMRGVYGCNPSVVDELAADSVVLSYPIFETLYHTPALRGRQAVREFAEGFCSRWKDTRLTVDESLADGDDVVVRARRAPWRG
ncbi:MAG: nuclear transport factor 2 family protein [Gemmatimonadota bacterium]